MPRRALIVSVKSGLALGPRWWSSGQRSRLLLWQSEFESCWLLILWTKRRKCLKKRPGLVHLFKKSRTALLEIALVIRRLYWSDLMSPIAAQKARGSNPCLHRQEIPLWTSIVSQVCWAPQSRLVLALLLSFNLIHLETLLSLLKVSMTLIILQKIDPLKTSNRSMATVD